MRNVTSEIYFLLLKSNETTHGKIHENVHLSTLQVEKQKMFW